MKRIEIKDQLRHRIALELSDRQMAEADEEYAAVKDRDIAEKGERALWERFAENCKEMEVI